MPETLVAALDDLTALYDAARNDPAVLGRVRTAAGRLRRAAVADLGGAAPGRGESAPRLLLKREDLNHTGAHKINNTIGQALLALRMGKRRIIAETGAGQHGVATATVCARFGLECVVYMGAEDVARQRLNVYRMELLGATVVPVESGTRTLKDATNEALRDWVTNVPTTHYIIGSVVGPDPVSAHGARLPVGDRTRGARTDARRATAGCRTRVVACVGGGSNAMGIFSGFLDDRRRPARRASRPPARGSESGHHSATLGAGSPGVLHGSLSYLLQDADGQVSPAHSISAGLDYPGVGPEHSFLRDSGRVAYESATDARGARRLSGRSAGPRASSRRSRPRTPSRGCGGWRDGGTTDALVLVCLSGRGDKDVAHVAALLGRTV